MRADAESKPAGYGELEFARRRRGRGGGVPGALVGGLVKTADTVQQKLPFGYCPIFDLATERLRARKAVVEME